MNKVFLLVFFCLFSSAIFADACRDSCSAQWDTCEGGCGRFSDARQKASCDLGCKRDRLACYTKCGAVQ